jgi:hypothetical protein
MNITTIILKNQFFLHILSEWHFFGVLGFWGFVCNFYSLQGAIAKLLVMFL